MQIKVTAADQVEVGMYVAEADEDLAPDDYDPENMDWQCVVNVDTHYADLTTLTLRMYNGETHTCTGQADGMVLVCADDAGRYVRDE